MKTTPGLHFRRYQLASFVDHSTKTVIEHWSRQIGKSYTYAAWAVDRLLRNPGRLVTVLSNSRDNGAEFVAKVREVCDRMGEIIDGLDQDDNADELDRSASLSEDVKFANMRFEVKITVGGKTGRIKVLAANPRTARGFSGDLILDEFAFHEDGAAIWEAAEPIISSNPDFLCRILSTGNGRRNMFYQLISEGRIQYRRIRRSDAWATGDLRIYSQIDGRETHADEAREQASDKRAYEQNYECAFEDENAALLTQELISAAERAGVVTIDRQDWTPASLARMERAAGRLEAGVDVGRTRDLTVVTVLEHTGTTRECIAMLEIENMRLPEQQRRLDAVCRMPGFRGDGDRHDGRGHGTLRVRAARQRHAGARGAFRVHGAGDGAHPGRGPESPDGARDGDHGDGPGGGVRGPGDHDPRRRAAARRSAQAREDHVARRAGEHRGGTGRGRPRGPFLEPGAGRARGQAPG